MHRHGDLEPGAFARLARFRNGDPGDRQDLPCEEQPGPGARTLLMKTFRKWNPVFIVIPGVDFL